MDDKRQKNQLVLAFREESRSEAPTASVKGTESSAGKRGTVETPTRDPDLSNPIQAEIVPFRLTWRLEFR